MYFGGFCYHWTQEASWLFYPKTATEVGTQHRLFTDRKLWQSWVQRHMRSLWQSQPSCSCDPWPIQKRWRVLTTLCTYIAFIIHNLDLSRVTQFNHRSNGDIEFPSGFEVHPHIIPLESKTEQLSSALQKLQHPLGYKLLMFCSQITGTNQMTSIANRCTSLSLYFMSLWLLVTDCTHPAASRLQSSDTGRKTHPGRSSPL